MTDIFDQASEQEEMLRNAAISNARVPIQKILPIGKCYNCEESLGDEHLFCDADCRDDWQKRNRAV